MKKRMILLTILVVLSMVLTACGGDSPPAGDEAPAAEAPAEEAPAEEAPAEEAPAEEAMDENVSITVWTLSSRTAGLEEIIDDFRAAYPNITIDVAYADGSTHQNNLLVGAATDTLPTLWFNWGGTLGGYYTENDLVYDFTDYAAANNWDQKFDKAGLDIMTLNGVMSAYPTSLSMVAVFYRADIFEKYGLSEPTTFDEFETILETLKENGECPITTAGSPNGGFHLMRLMEQLWEHYAGPELHDSLNNMEASWDNEAIVQAFAKFQEWVDKGYFNEGFVTADPDVAPTKLYSGECVMVFEGQWAETNLINAEQDPSLFGVFPFPNGGTNRMSAFGEGYQFNANVTDAELAAGLAFMDYYYGVDTVTALPTNYKYPMPVQGVSMPAEFVLTAEMVEAVGESGTFTINDQALPKEVIQALFAIQDNLALGLMTPEEGAAALQEAVDLYLANN